MNVLKFLSEIDKGNAVGELGIALAEVVAAVQLTGKKGKVSVTISIEPASKSAEVLGIEAEVKAAAPKPDRKLDIFFANERGELSRNNARQMSIDDLRKPETEGAPVTPLRKV